MKEQTWLVIILCSALYCMWQVVLGAFIINAAEKIAKAIKKAHRD